MSIYCEIKNKNSFTQLASVRDFILECTLIAMMMYAVIWFIFGFVFFSHLSIVVRLCSMRNQQAQNVKTRRKTTNIYTSMGIYRLCAVVLLSVVCIIIGMARGAVDIIN